jgi:hypothetical protein
MTSPSQRSLKHVRTNGYTAQVVERWNAFARVRQDLFGFIDIVAIKPGAILGVQATSYSNISARVKKILSNESTRTWLLSGGIIEVHGWRKVKNRYEVKIRPVTLEDLDVSAEGSEENQEANR